MKPLHCIPIYLHTYLDLLIIKVLFLGKTDDTNVLPLPKLLHGEYDDEAQNGVMVFTGKSLSEALILGSTNPQYGKRLFIDLPV